MIDFEFYAKYLLLISNLLILEYMLKNLFPIFLKKNKKIIIIYIKIHINIIDQNIFY